MDSRRGEALYYGGLDSGGMRVRMQKDLQMGGKGMAKAKRTTHRSSSGTKLYAVRDSKGRFKDIQTYKRAHSADLKRTSKAEAKKKK
jgi:hypothetical protein